MGVGAAVGATGAEEELNYTNSSKPSTVFIDTQSAFTVKPGQEFTINVKCTDNMKWCHAVLFADWNRDFDFNDEGEIIKRVGKEAFEDSNLSKTGNTEMKDFSVTITVPEDAKAAETRLRIQFTDAWHQKDNPGHTHTAMDPIDQGGCYDFIMNIKPESSVDVALLTFNKPENGKIEVRYPGEEELLDNNEYILVGENVEITLIPDTDYKVASLKINGTDRTEDVADNKLVVEVPAETLNIEAEFSPVTGINESQLTEVTVRPTVFDSEVILTSNSKGEARFYDITGQILMTTDLNEGENVLSTSNLPSGSIILVVTTAEGTKSFNLIRK